MGTSRFPDAPRRIGTPKLRHVVLILTVVVAGDLLSMAVARVVLPNASVALFDVATVVLLVAVVAPILWLVVMRPLHRDAIAERLRSEEALRAAGAAQSQYRTIVETAQEGIWVFGPDGRTTYANRRVAEMLGHTPEQMLGRSFFDFMDEDGRAFARQTQARSTTGLSGQHDFRFRRSDGRDLWAVVTANPLPSGEGGTAGALAMLTEITERKRAEEEAHTLSAALAQAADCVVLTDPDGVILWVNEAFERLTGYTRAEVLGKTPRILKSGEQEPEFYVDLWRTIKAGRVFRAMLINRTKHGELYYLDQTITPIRTDAGRITNFVAAGREIRDVVQTAAPDASEATPSAG